jgi:hypothetical protein
MANRAGVFARAARFTGSVPWDGETYIELVVAAGVLVEAGFVESEVGAGAEVAGVLVSMVGAGAAMLVSAGGVVELVIVLSVLLLQPARAKGRLRVRSASRE